MNNQLDPLFMRFDVRTKKGHKHVENRVKNRSYEQSIGYTFHEI